MVGAVGIMLGFQRDAGKGTVGRAAVSRGVEPLAAVGLAKPLALIFVGYDKTLTDMTVRGFVIYGLSFLFSGFNIFGSSMFTALNNGLVSAVISFVRTLVCQIAAVVLLPLVWGVDGIWWSVVVAEFAALVLTAVFFFALRKRYHYA